MRLLKFIFDWRLFLSIIDKLIKMNDESKDANVFNSASDMMPGQDGGIMMPPVGGTMRGTIQAEDVIDDDHKIELSEEERYLGDLITPDGKNSKNMKAKKAKGIGIINQRRILFRY